MKLVFYILLYLNIYALSQNDLVAQQLYLETTTEKPQFKTLTDSLQENSAFQDYNSLKEEADTIKSKLLRKGYLAATLRSLSATNDSTYLATYSLGKKSDVIKVYYSPEQFTERQLRTVSSDVTESYFILRIETAEQSLQKLNTLLTDTGDAFARLRLKNIQRVANEIHADVSIETTSKRTIDSIVIKGYEKFPRSFLKNYAGIKKNKPFSRSKLLKQNTILDNLGFAKSTKAPEILFREESTTAYFYLEKLNNNLFDGILGFATDETSQRLQLNGYINLELNNNLNYGEQLIINYKADGNEQQNFRAKATMPYVLQSPFGLGLELKIFKRDSTFVTTEQLIQATYQVNPISTIRTGYKSYESSNLLDLAIVGSPIEDYDSKFFLVGGTVTLPQNSSLFPVKSFLDIDTEIGERESKGLQEDQIRVFARASHIFNLNPTNSLYVQNATGALFSDSFFTNELFRFGGINSIRGFNENSIDASLYSVLNSEYRYILNPGLYIHSIIDLGYFENEVMDQKEKLYSFGLGLGLQTRGGLLKFNIANGNSENQDFRFSNTKIHLSLSSRF
ncbi:MAG: hypothetical protein R3359_03260 [Marinirhabdus sp.]|nr:hypothetical protein [Marinirhabdus sp.]